MSEVSECCGAPIIYTDVCSECKEHCDIVSDEEEESSAEVFKTIMDGMFGGKK